MQNQNRRKLCLAMAGAPLLASQAGRALAQSRAFSVVVPYTPGGSTDLLGRLFAEGLSHQVNEKVIVENRPGANGTLGAAYVAGTPGDGRTLLYTFGNLMLNQEYMMKDLRFHAMDQLVPVARTCITQAVILAKADSPVNDLRDFIALAKRAPGKQTFAYYGDLGILAMAAEAGIDLLRIPYKGGLPGMIDVAAGNVDIITSTVAQAAPMMRGGKVKAIAVFGDDRLSEWPNVPTIKEILPNYKAVDYQVVMAPKSTPKPVLDQLAARINAVLNSPEVRKGFLDKGAIVSPMKPDELRAFMDADLANIGRIIKAAGIQPE